MLLALAGEIEDRDADGYLTGRLGAAEEIAWHLHTRLERIQPSLERLIQLGLLHQDASGILAIADFAADQSADTPAERMQRYRRRTKATASPLRERDAAVTPALRERDVAVTRWMNQNRAESEQNKNQNNNSTEQEQSGVLLLLLLWITLGICRL